MHESRVLGIVGWSGAGKTTLLTKLIPELVRRGVRVSTLKHAHHNFDVDKPGKDSWLHREAGAGEVLISSARRWVLMHENRAEPEPSLPALLRRLSPCDLVLIEGFKRESHPKLEVHRAEVGKPRLYPEDPRVLAIATDHPLDDCAVPRIDLNDVAAVADFVLASAVPLAAVLAALEK